MATVAYVNPRKRARRKNPTAKQRAWRKKFGAMYGGGKKRRANPAKRRRKQYMQSVKRHGHKVSRATWKRSGYTRNPRRRRASYRRNPSARLSFKSIQTQLMGAAQGATGSVLVDIAMGQVAPMLPAALLTLNTYPLVKIGVALGMGALGSAVAPSRWHGAIAEMAKGSMTVTLAQVVRGFMPSNIVLGRRRSLGFNAAGQQVLPDTGWNRSAGMGEFMHGRRTRQSERFGEFIQRSR